MSGSSRPSTKEISTRKDFLIPRHLGINQLIIEGETPVKYKVTFAIGIYLCYFVSLAAKNGVQLNLFVWHNLFYSNKG